MMDNQNGRDGEIDMLEIGTIAPEFTLKDQNAKEEIMMTIMASFAHQESQSLSQNVKLGLQYRYQQGKIRFA